MVHLTSQNAPLYEPHLCSGDPRRSPPSLCSQTGLFRNQFNVNSPRFKVSSPLGDQATTDYSSKAHTNYSSGTTWRRELPETPTLDYPTHTNTTRQYYGVIRHDDCRNNVIEESRKASLYPSPLQSLSQQLKYHTFLSNGGVAPITLHSNRVDQMDRTAKEDQLTSIGSPSLLSRHYSHSIKKPVTSDFCSTVSPERRQRGQRPYNGAIVPRFGTSESEGSAYGIQQIPTFDSNGVEFFNSFRSSTHSMDMKCQTDESVSSDPLYKCLRSFKVEDHSSVANEEEEEERVIGRKSQLPTEPVDNRIVRDDPGPGRNSCLVVPTDREPLFTFVKRDESPEKQTNEVGSSSLDRHNSLSELLDFLPATARSSSSGGGQMSSSVADCAKSQASLSVIRRFQSRFKDSLISRPERASPLGSSKVRDKLHPLLFNPMGLMESVKSNEALSTKDVKRKSEEGNEEESRIMDNDQMSVDLSYSPTDPREFIFSSPPVDSVPSFFPKDSVSSSVPTDSVPSSVPKDPVTSFLPKECLSPPALNCLGRDPDPYLVHCLTEANSETTVKFPEVLDFGTQKDLEIQKDFGTQKDFWTPNDGQTPSLFTVYSTADSPLHERVGGCVHCGVSSRSDNSLRNNATHCLSDNYHFSNCQKSEDSDSHASSVNPLVNPVELVRCTTLLSPTISDEDHLQRRLARAFHSMAKNSNSLFDIINGDIKGAPTTTPSLLVVPVCFSRHSSCSALHGFLFLVCYILHFAFIIPFVVCFNFSKVSLILATTMHVALAIALYSWFHISTQYHFEDSKRRYLTQIAEELIGSSLGADYTFFGLFTQTPIAVFLHLIYKGSIKSCEFIISLNCSKRRWLWSSIFSFTLGVWFIAISFLSTVQFLPVEWCSR